MNGEKRLQKTGRQPSRSKEERRVPALKGDSEVDEKRIMAVWRAKEEKRKMRH